MISASKTTFSHYNLKILRPKVTKNIKNLRKFLSFHTSHLFHMLVADWRRIEKDLIKKQRTQDSMNRPRKSDQKQNA